MVKIRIIGRSKKIYFCIISLFFLWLGCLATHTTVYGETVSSIFSRAVPKGLNTQPWLTLGQIPNNMTTFRTMTNGTTAVIVTQETANGFGSVWSKTSADNTFDLTKRQTLDMWVYFGKRSSGAGDGLTFVLQNDPAGPQAFAKTATGALAGGETLGTWGAPAVNDTPALTAQRGIQNSWALSFDAYLNANQTDFTDQFDRHLGLTSGERFQHIMANYPGSATAYGADGSLDHQNLALLKDHFTDSTQQYFNNGTWRHLRLRWEPTAKTMTYTFDDALFDDDLKPDGAPSGKGFSKTVPVDVTQFHLAPGQHTVRWGFTGTTQQGLANQIVIFETMPSIVEQNSQVEVRDMTQDRLIQSNDSVVGGDELRVRYTLDFLSGAQSWENISGALTLPNSMAYTTAKITYPDTGLPAERINLNNMSYFQIKQKIGQALNHAVPKAILDFTGNPAGTNVTVIPETSRFTGTQSIATVTTPQFYIRNGRPLTIHATTTTVTADRGTPAILKGTLAYQDHSPVDNTRVTLFAKINGATTSLQAMVSAGSQVSGQYNLAIPADRLQPGANQVQVYALDRDGNRTSTIDYTVNVTGFMTLQVAPEMYFQQGTISPIPQLLRRQAGWSVRLTDTLAMGAHWAVQATATKLYQNEVPLYGDVIYVDGDRQRHVLTDQLVTVASGTKQTVGTTTTEITNQWQPDTGLLLLTTGPNHLGAYTGTIHWQVIQSLP